MAAGRVLVVSGPPAAGKTTVSEILTARRSPSVHLHADDFWGFIKVGYIDPWLPDSHQQNVVVIDAVCTSAGVFARGGYDVVLDACLGPWFVPDLMALIGDSVEIDYAVLLPPWETVRHQLGDRTDHGFTSEDAALHMYREFASSLTGFESHVIDAAGAPPEEVADAVEAAATEGRLRLTAPEVS
jgi:predicted kinase